MVINLDITNNFLNKHENSAELFQILKSTINTSKDGIYVCDKEGKTLIVNDALIEMTNIDKNIFYKYELHDLITKNILPNSCAYQTLKTKEKSNMIIDYYGGKKAVLTSTPVFNQTNDIICVVSNVRDITELNNLKYKLEETNKLNIEYLNLLYKNNQLQNDFDSEIVYRSNIMMKIISLAFKFSQIDSPILILGESGVGKDVLAKYIHKKSNRTGDFIRINCGALPENLIESELFGYEKGAFTGANEAKQGLFELANQGTIFLDEIGDMPYELQVKLLHVVENKEVRRLGSENTIKVDIRIIAATNRDLLTMIKDKKFRNDLYYRLNILSITIPPLRKRKEDIAILIFHFLNQLNEKHNMKKEITPEVLDYLLFYNWPGNIRELNNVIERMFHMSFEDVMGLKLLSNIIHKHNNINQADLAIDNSVDFTIPLESAINQFEKKHIKKVLKNNLTLKENSELLGISVSTLIRRMRKHGI